MLNYAQLFFLEVFVLQVNRLDTSLLRSDAQWFLYLAFSARDNFCEISLVTHYLLRLSRHNS